MRRIFGELLMTAGAVTILLIVLAASDARVRDQLMGRADRSAQVGGVMVQVRNSADTVGAIVRAESRAHTPLLIFTVAASILVVFMLRT